MNKTRSILSVSTALLGLTILASCADKMTDQQSAMKGGSQRSTATFPNPTPSNTDGMGHPMAGGKVNSVPDSMWNQNSAADRKPF